MSQGPSGSPTISHEASQAKKKNDWIGYGVLGVLLVAFMAYRQLKPPPEVGQVHPAVTKQAQLQEFRVEPLLNVEQSLELAELDGRVSLINLWGPWCGFCLQEMPHIVEMKSRWPEKLQLISISYPSDPSQPEDEFRQETEGVLRIMKAEFPVYHDPHVECQTFFRKVGIFFKGFPCTVVVDEQRTIRGVWLGYRSGYDKEMEMVLEELLGS